MSKQLRQIIACSTSDGDIFSVLHFTVAAPPTTGTIVSLQGADLYHTDQGLSVTRISDDEYHLSHTGQTLTRIRRSGHHSHPLSA